MTHFENRTQQYMNGIAIGANRAKVYEAHIRGQEQMLERVLEILKSERPLIPNGTPFIWEGIGKQVTYQLLKRLEEEG